jgi:hypothetical protein
LGLAALALLVLGFRAASAVSVFAAFAVAAFAVAGFAVAGFAVAGFAVAGFAVVGFAVVGFAVAAFAVAAFAAGFAVAGFAVAAFASVVAGSLFSDSVVAGLVFSASVVAASVCSFAACVPTALADVAARVAEVFDAAVVFVVTGLTGANALGISADIALAASVSDLTAVPIALVAALVACNAVVIVFAQEVARVAAVFGFAAAAVTLVAAAETTRGVTAVPLADDLAESVRLAPAVAWRVGFAAALCAGTDLPPIWISYGESHSMRCKILHIVTAHTTRSDEVSGVGGPIRPLLAAGRRRP